MAANQLPGVPDHILLVATLCLVNAARHACGESWLKQMPKGEKGSPCTCPIALAFDFLGEVDVDLMLSVPPAGREKARLVGEAWGLGAASAQVFDSGWTHIDLGPIISEFRHRFDSGHYPELEIKG
jgi:hypothetical protein